MFLTFPRKGLSGSPPEPIFPPTAEPVGIQIGGLMNVRSLLESEIVLLIVGHTRLCKCNVKEETYLWIHHALPQPLPNFTPSS